MAVQGTALVGNKMFALASMVGLGEPPIAQPERVLPVSLGPTRLTLQTRPTKRSSAPTREYATELPVPASASLDLQGTLVSEVFVPTGAQDVGHAAPLVTCPTTWDPNTTRPPAILSVGMDSDPSTRIGTKRPSICASAAWGSSGRIAH